MRGPVRHFIVCPTGERMRDPIILTACGGMYGLRVPPGDRCRFAGRHEVEIILPGIDRPSQRLMANITPSFWRSRTDPKRCCPEFRSWEIGRWLAECGLLPWPEDRPPHFTAKVSHLGEVVEIVGRGSETARVQSNCPTGRMRDPIIELTAWCGGTYLRVPPGDRCRFAGRHEVEIILPGFHPSQRLMAKITPSFRTRGSLRSPEIVRWLAECRLLPWPKGRPPRFAAKVSHLGKVVEIVRKMPGR